MKAIDGVMCLVAVVGLGLPVALAGSKKAELPAPLTQDGEKLLARYAATLAALKAEIVQALPAVAEQKKAALEKARDAIKKAMAEANAAQQPQNKVKAAQGLVEHAKGKWIGGAQKGIAQAQAALKKATTEAQREAANTDMAKWQANLEEGKKALQERQAALEKAKAEEQAASQSQQAAQAALAKAQADETAAVKALLADVEPFLSSDKLDARLVKAAVMAEATAHGLAEYSQQGAQQAATVEKLLADDNLMKEMLVAGGASYGKYGRAMEIYTAIQKVSSKCNESPLARLALATSLEHAVPIKQANAKDQTNAPSLVDPVRRYQHYEKAFLGGELDPAFKNLTAWEMRMVVDCDAPDEILAWGREMLRTYRPDHVSNPNYGWRYSATVKTEVRYGSQNVKEDLPSLHEYQNIPKDGGVCGRRAFFGRFILRCFGIPVWGVTQHKHAALSHWTPKGWVVNLGAGFPHSWWDKDEVSRSGSDFLLETQAREHPQEYLKVLRAQWISRVLGEQAYNDRKNVAGGFWSGMGHYEAMAIAAKAVELGPLGQDLAESNESKAPEKDESETVTDADRNVRVGGSGVITVPAVAHEKATGSAKAMKSCSGGMQMHCSGGFKTTYRIDAPQAGTYALSARVATLQEGQTFLVAANDAKAPVEIAVPYTIGLWQQTRPLEVALVKGPNVLNVALKDGSRGVTIKQFTLTPVK